MLPLRCDTGRTGDVCVRDQVNELWHYKGEVGYELEFLGAFLDDWDLDGHGA